MCWRMWLLGGMCLLCDGVLSCLLTFYTAVMGFEILCNGVCYLVASQYWTEMQLGLAGGSPTHNRGTQEKPGIGVKPGINPGSGCE